MSGDAVLGTEKAGGEAERRGHSSYPSSAGCNQPFAMQLLLSRAVMEARPVCMGCASNAAWRWLGMSTADLTIRPAALPDAEEMARLAGELGYPMEHGEMERRLERLLANERHHIVVASAVAGRLVAWMHV